MPAFSFKKSHLSAVMREGGFFRCISFRARTGAVKSDCAKTEKLGPERRYRTITCANWKMHKGGRVPAAAATMTGISHHHLRRRHAPRTAAQGRVLRDCHHRAVSPPGKQRGGGPHRDVSGGRFRAPRGGHHGGTVGAARSRPPPSAN